MDLTLLGRSVKNVQINVFLEMHFRSNLCILFPQMLVVGLACWF